MTDRRLYWRQSGIRAIRDGDWKLIARGSELTDPELFNPELFNLKEDPYEKYGIGENQPEIREKLLELICQWPGHDPDFFDLLTI